MTEQYARIKGIPGQYVLEIWTGTDGTGIKVRADQTIQDIEAVYHMQIPGGYIIPQWVQKG